MTLDDLQAQLRIAVIGMDAPPSGDDLWDRRRFKDCALDALLLLKAEANFLCNLVGQCNVAGPALEACGELGLAILGDLGDRNVSLTARELFIIFEVPETVLAATEEHAGKGSWRGLDATPFRHSETPLADVMWDAMIRAIMANKKATEKVMVYLEVNNGLVF